MKIENDGNFFYHTLEFPMFYEHNDTTILRVPVASNPDNSITMSSDIAERIRKCFAGTAFPQAKFLTVSIGVSQAKSNDTLDTLCVRVDEALYDAKQSGKNKVVVC